MHYRVSPGRQVARLPPFRTCYVMLWEQHDIAMVWMRLRYRRFRAVHRVLTVQMPIRQFLRYAFCWRLKTLARASRAARFYWKGLEESSARTVCSAPAWQKNTGEEIQRTRWSVERIGHSVAFHTAGTDPAVGAD